MTSTDLHPSPTPEGFGTDGTLQGARILFVVNEPNFFLTHRKPVADAAAVAGCEVHVAAPPTKGFSSIAAAGFVPHAISLDRRSINPFTELVSIRALTRLYRDVKPDLVHHVTIKPTIYGGIASRIAGVPCVVNAVTGLGWAFTAVGIKARLVRAIVEAGYRAALGRHNVATIFQNDDDRQLFVARRLLRDESAATIRGSGVDLARWPPLGPPVGDPPIVVLPGRILKEKGVATFVAAARHLRFRGIAVRMVLVGSVDGGNRGSFTEDQIMRWVREGVVEWWGQRSDMHEVYRQAAAVCLPSYREGVPLALLEASCCARAIVTTDAPGCRDVVQHGESGLLVPVEDPHALANALTTILADPASRERMGVAARARMERVFSVEQVVAATLAVYVRLLKSPERLSRRLAKAHVDDHFENGQATA